MSVLFNHAIRYEWLEQGKNPITLVRQSTARQKTHEVLDPHEIQNLLILWNALRLMVLLAATTGLRRSELFALKWSDIDFTDRMINVSRSIDGEVFGNCKTLGILVQSRRDKKAAKKFFRRLLKGLRYVPCMIVTDKLKSYGAAKNEILPSVEHIKQKYQQNRAENYTNLN